MESALPSHNSPATGTPPAGNPATGTPPTGTPPTGTPPSHGHPSHGHPSHGHPSHGHPSHGQTSHGQTSHGHLPHGHPSHGRPRGGEGRDRWQVCGLPLYVGVYAREDWAWSREECRVGCERVSLFTCARAPVPSVTTRLESSDSCITGWYRVRLPCGVPTAVGGPVRCEGEFPSAVKVGSRRV